MTGERPGVGWSLPRMLLFAVLGGLAWTALFALAFKVLGWW
jgi:hypothetical protein